MMGEGRLHIALVAGLLYSLILVTAASDYEQQFDESDILDMNRNKRYTDAQESANSFCTGMCMYHERMKYSDCYDICHWNGHGTSPWLKLDKEKARTAQRPAEDTDTQSMMMRTGIKSKAKARQGGSKKNVF